MGGGGHERTLISLIRRDSVGGGWVGGGEIGGGGGGVG